MKKHIDYTNQDFLEDETFQAYVFGFNEKDAAYWQQWLAAHPHKAEEAREAQTFLTDISDNYTHQPHPTHYQQDLQRLKNHLHAEPERKVFPLNPDSYREGGQGVVLRYAIAASVTIIAAIGIWFFLLPFVQTQHIASQHTITKQTENGQKLTLTLPDGSVVKLNAGSSISYLENFGDTPSSAKVSAGRRELNLTGEAYFEVATDKQKPFIVHAGSLTTTVLGTSFNINAYEEGIQVTVATGKVKVETKETSTRQHASRKLSGTSTLTANQQITYNNNTKELTKTTIDATTALAWTQGTLRLHQATLSETTQTLERWYGVKINIKGAPQEAWAVNGEFQNQALERILENISYTTPFTWKLEGKHVMIEFKTKNEK